LRRSIRVSLPAMPGMGVGRIGRFVDAAWAPLLGSGTDAAYRGTWGHRGAA